MNPTTEQSNIIKLVATEANIAISARAGTGKTSTLKLIAQSYPELTFGAIYFNKANVDELNASFSKPSNLIGTTIHGAAYKAIMLGGFSKKLSPYLDFNDIPQEHLDNLCQGIGIPVQNYRKESINFTKIILDVIKEFCKSDEYNIEQTAVSILPDLLESYHEGIEDDIIWAIIQHWKHITSSNNAKITHDVYLKMFHLGEYQLTELWDSQAKYSRKIDVLFLDEAQDSNPVTLGIIANQKVQKIIVGDPAQCLIEGTIVDGRPIETFKVSDSITTVVKGSKRQSVITDIFKTSIAEEVITITTKSGKILTSTKSHTHIVEGLQQKHGYLIYLMYKEGYGFRIGCTQDFKQRQSTERCDKAWVIKVFGDNQLEARIFEQVTAFTFGIPTLIFTGRCGKEEFPDSYYKDVFTKIDSTTGALQLLDSLGLSFDRPHFLPQATSENKITLTITTMGDVRGAGILHKFAVFLSAKQADTFKVAYPHYSIRESKKGQQGFRIESSTKNLAVCYKLLEDLKTCFPQTEVKELIAVTLTKSLQLKPASDLHIGMSVQIETETGLELDEIIAIQKHFYEGFVYDFNVAETHNFVANGITTHNCIYGWRGAVGTMNNFDSWEQASLTTSFRFTPKIADIANVVLKQRGEGNLLTGVGKADPTAGKVILCRRNATIWKLAFTRALEGKFTYVESDFKTLKGDLYHISALMSGNYPKFPSKNLSMYKTKEDLIKASKIHDELATLINLGNTMRGFGGGGLAGSLKLLQEYLLEQKDPDVLCLSSIHKSKGLEWDEVEIAEDFIKLPEMEEFDIQELVDDMWLDEEMTSLLYVAITRAKECVTFPWYLQSEFSAALY